MCNNLGGAGGYVHLGATMLGNLNDHVGRAGMVAGKTGPVAEVFSRRKAEFAMPASRAKPSDAHALAERKSPALHSQGINDAHNLVARHDRHFLLGAFMTMLMIHGGDCR